MQLVLTDRSTLTEGRDFSVIGVRTWRLADLGSKYALLLAGIGWGNMPEPMVHDDLAAGRLRRLKLSEWSGGFYAFHAIYRADTPPGPAAGWMIRHFAEQVRERRLSCRLCIDTPHRLTSRSSARQELQRYVQPAEPPALSGRQSPSRWRCP